MIGYVQDCSFPNLKILKLGESYVNCDPTYMTALLRALVGRAPKLQELHAQGPMSLMLNVLEGRSTVMLVLQCYVSIENILDIPDDAIKIIRLEYLRLFYNGPDFNLERFHRIAPLLLRKFSATLHSIDVDAFPAVVLMCYGIRLENVKNLKMDIVYLDLERSEPRILRILKDFDFTRIFPNLRKVLISPNFYTPGLLIEHMILEQANEVLKDPQADRSFNIFELDMTGSISISNAEFYAEMFPHIQRLRVEEVDGEVSLGSIWKNWVNLQELYVLVDVKRHVEGLDSVFCGIFSEEVAELRQQDEEFLKKVNIVPVMPAMTCLRNLRKLDLVFLPLARQAFDFNVQEYLQPPPPLSIVFSKVTEFIAFAKNPQLAVTRGTNVYRCF